MSDMTPPSQTRLTEELRAAANKLRTSSIPLADFIPLLQRAADALPSPAAVAGGVDPTDTKEFYLLMQDYRHAPVTDQEAACDAFDAVRAWIRARPAPVAVAEWQPIASAPRDGRSLLLAHATFVTEGYRDHLGVYRCIQSNDEPCFPFTHWQPLPPAPYTAAGERDSATTHNQE